MAIWSLKCGGEPDQTYSVVLDYVSYDIRLRWNNRDESWQLTIGNSGLPPSIKFKVTNGINLLKGYYHLTGVPEGSLFAVDMVTGFGRVDYDEFGIDKRFNLVYISNED